MYACGTCDSAHSKFNKFFCRFDCLLSSLSKTNQLHFNCEIFSAENSQGPLRKEIEPLILNEKWLLRFGSSRLCFANSCQEGGTTLKSKHRDLS